MKIKFASGSLVRPELSRRPLALIMMLWSMSAVCQLLSGQSHYTGFIKGRVLFTSTGTCGATGNDYEATRLTARSREYGFQVSTDLDRETGRFLFPPLPKGKWVVEPFAQGYKPTRTYQADVVPNEEQPVRISPICMTSAQRRSRPQLFVARQILQFDRPVLLSRGWLQFAGSSADNLSRGSVSSTAVQETAEPMSAEPENVFDRQFMFPKFRDLPLPGYRGVDTLALLVPGVLPAAEGAATNGPSVGPGVGTPGQFSANGLRPRDNNFTIDGTDNNDEESGIRRQGFVIPAPQSIESISELQVLPILADVRFGRNASAQVNAFSASGSSEVHVAFYGFFSNRSLNARNVFDSEPGQLPETAPVLDDHGRPASAADGLLLSTRSPVSVKPPWTRLMTGGNLSVPVRRQRTYAFFSIEKLRQRAAQQENFAVPTVSQRGFSATKNEDTFPSTFAGNAIFSLFPFPNNPDGPYGRNTFSRVLPADQDGLMSSIRLDNYLEFGRMHHVTSVRLNYGSEKSTISSVGRALYSTLREKGALSSLAAFLSSNAKEGGWANTFRASWGQSRFTFEIPQDPLLLPSTQISSVPGLLNRPLMLNKTLGDGAPVFVRASSLDLDARLLANRIGLPVVPDTTDQLTGPIGQVRVVGFSPLGADVFYFPQRRNDSTLQIADTGDYVRSGRLLSFGFETWLINLDSNANKNSRPAMEFFGQHVRTNLPDGREQSPIRLASALDVAASGIPSATYQTLYAGCPHVVSQVAGCSGPAGVAEATLRLRRFQFDWFVNGRAQLTERLHLSAGLRLNFNNLPYSESGAFEESFSTFRFDQRLQAAAGQCSEPVFQAGPQCRPALREIAATFPGDYRYVFGADTFGWDPRLGIAWGSRGGDVTVRAGIGMYTGQFPAIILTESSSTFPSYLPVVYRPSSRSDVVFRNISFQNDPLQATQPAGTSLLERNSINRLRPDLAVDPLVLLAQTSTFGLATLQPIQPGAGLKNPRALQFGLAVEAKLGGHFAATVGYSGSRARNLLRVTTPMARAQSLLFLNQPLGIELCSFIAPCAPSKFPSMHAQYPVPVSGGAVPDYTYVSPRLFASTASSSYHSMLADVQIRLPGLFAGSGFTWSHSLDDASDFFDDAGGFALPQSSLTSNEWASSNFDIRLRSVTYFSYHPRFASAALRNLGIDGVLTVQSGRPFTVNSTFDVNADGNLTDRLDNFAALRGGHGSTVIRVRPGATFDDIWPNCRVTQTGYSLPIIQGCVGGAGRNSFRGHGMTELNLAISRVFNLRAQRSLTLRVEIFNALNHPNFGIPVRMLEAPSFGQVYRTVTPARIMQAVLRVGF